VIAVVEPKATTIYKDREYYSCVVGDDSSEGHTGLLRLLPFSPGSVNVPNSHPYGAECLFLMEGTVDAGLVDFNKTLHMQTLHVGDLLVFPERNDSFPDQLQQE
jgi:hypothetical protein